MPKIQKTFQLSCGFVPGSACLDCPYSDCIAKSDWRISVEERTMTACGHEEVIGRQEIAPYGELTSTVTVKQKQYRRGLRVYHRSREWIEGLIKSFGSRSEYELKRNVLLQNHIDYEPNSNIDGEEYLRSRKRGIA